jgi:D-glycero-alpha-D-manno-heptose-7-phosphate kinase
MQVIKQGSVRVDLCGGTLDIPPINLIIKDVVTLNVATSLKAKVILSKTDSNSIEIISHDYDKSEVFPSEVFTTDNIYFNNYFKELTFIIQLIDLFGIKKNLKVELSSGAPAGSGLGGSSSMGATLYSALCEFTGAAFDRERAIRQVNLTEGRILNSGMPGYQDYYPALYGGVLALIPHTGEVKVEQLFSTELAHVLESRCTLVFSGESRLSGINNWEVYKAFFDKNDSVIHGLNQIAKISFDAYKALKMKNYDSLLSLIAQEGIERKRLFPKIVTPGMEKVMVEIQNSTKSSGMKVCGAGGGGCFLITHQESERELVKKIIEKTQMKVLDFKVEGPL